MKIHGVTRMQESEFFSDGIPVLPKRRVTMELLSKFSDQLFQVFDCKRLCAAMNHFVAIGANRSQVGDRIHFVFFSNFRQGLQMMNMDKSASERAKLFFEIKAANRAKAPVVLDR